MTPSHDGAIPPDRSKGSFSCLNLLHILQLVSHNTAITTHASKSPSNHAAILQDRSLCSSISLNLLHILQMRLHSIAITAEDGMAPCHDGAIPQDRSESTPSAAYVHSSNLQRQRLPMRQPGLLYRCSSLNPKP